MSENTKEVKETKVIPLNKDIVKEPLVLQLNQDDANSFLTVLGIVLIGDDRLISIQRNYVEMLKRNNGSNPK